MARFLVEVGHDAERVACARAVKVFLESGSHFLTHAVWGCSDGVHSSWMIIDADSKQEACTVVPPAFRARTRIIGLNDFSVEEIEGILGYHGAAQQP